MALGDVLNLGRRRRVPRPRRVVVSRAGPAGTRAALSRDLGRCRTLAHWLDARFSVGGIRFGLDGIIGFALPVFGDVLTMLAGCYPIYVAGRHGLGAWVILRMLGNLTLDLLLGLVPVLDVLLDVAFKAHLKNLRLLERAIERAAAGR